MDIKNIPFALPYLGEEEEEAVIRVLRSGWLTTGKETLDFEKEFTSFLQSAAPSHTASLAALAVNSATSGLHLALEAVGTKQGDLVLVPSYTFTSTAEVARYLGAEVVFVDVKPGTFLIDPEALEKTLERLQQGLPAYPPRKKDENGEGFGPKGKACAVIPVHFGGLVCDMESIMKIAEKYHISVIEDAAHAFPSILEKKTASRISAGCIGDIGVFSFYATKTITTGEGGMIVTSNPELAKRMAIMRSHGIDRNVWNRYTDTKSSWYYEVVEPGFKYNMPDLLAAVGRAQLKRAMDLFNMRTEIAKQYNEAFKNDKRFIIPPNGSGNSWHLYPLRIKAENLSISRDEIIIKLKAKGIHVSVHFIPLHIMPYYQNRYHLLPEDFPETFASFSAEISLPIWPGMTEHHINKVIESIQNSANKADEKRHKD
jgi:dTDP-4-amino-4,6-dideoxygalactose transaminase